MKMRAISSKGKRVLSLALVTSMLFLTACGGKNSSVSVYDYEKESDELTYFSSSDSDLDFFLNDYFKRHIGYIDSEEGDMTVNSIKPGAGYDGMYNFEWVTMALTWMNCFDSLDSDRLTTIKNSLKSVPIDRYGYVWDGTDTTKGTLTSLYDTGVHSMGWPFPKATDSEGWSTYWDFNGEKGSYEGEAWTSNFNAEIKNGLFVGTVTEGADKIEFISPALSSINTIMTYHAPYLELDLRMYTKDYANLEDVYIWYKNDASEEWSTEKRVSITEIAAINYDFSSNYEHVLYLPMYAEENWNSNDNLEIAQMKVQIVAKEGTTVKGKFGLNYVRPSYDTRHTNANSSYITCLKYYYLYTGDLEYLKEAIVEARKAMNFYMQMYNEERHLNSQSYLIGHEGDKSAKTTAEKMSSSLTNGYWDVMFMADYDFQSNMYFYKALVDLAELERILKAEGVEVEMSLSDVITADRECNKSTSAYTWDADALDKVAADVLAELRRSADDDTQTGFYDKETGRFIAGYDAQGNKLDYGYVMWNLEAVYLGIADDKQAQSIMDWISGERIVEMDKASEGSWGEDIYYYEFAPRITTTNKDGVFTGYYDDASGGNVPFGIKQIQYGGAALFLSYYDLMNRIELYGSDNSFERLKGIQNWYEKVYDFYKNENENPTPFDFYWDYYKQKLNITPQSGVHDGGGSGIVGLDGEFFESLLTIASIPYGFFGINSEDGKTLTVEPTLPEELDYWKIENLAFNYVKYDVTVFENAVRIDSVRGDAEGLDLKLSLDAKERNYTVYVNGVETKDYIEEDGKVIVTVPFASTIVEIK